MLKNLRSSLLGAAAITLLLISGTANAAFIPVDLAPAPIVIGGWGTGGSLSIVFAGNTGTNDALEHPVFPFPNEVTSFTASYTEAGPLGTQVWTGIADPFNPLSSGLASLLFNSNPTGDAGELVALAASQALLPGQPLPFRLVVGSGVSDSANRAEIQSFGGQVIASSAIPQNVPVPGSMALLGLGLVILRRTLRRPV